MLHIPLDSELQTQVSPNAIPYYVILP
jgi:hypothetical protein